MKSSFVFSSSDLFALTLTVDWMMSYEMSGSEPGRSTKAYGSKHAEALRKSVSMTTKYDIHGGGRKEGRKEGANAPALHIIG